MVNKLLRYAFNYMGVKIGLKTPLNLILYITNKCNMRCAHCFYWKELNTKQELLTLEEIEKIAKSLKHRLNVLMITGGEPFLREDIDKICEIFVKHNKVKKINIATNGYFTEVIYNKVKTILETNNVELSLQISIDSLYANHDEFRGTKGAFDKAVNTIGALNTLKKTHKKLSIAILSVLSNYNYKDVDALATHIRENLGVRHSFEIVRGSDFSMYGGAKEIDVNPRSKDILLPPQEKFSELLKSVKETYKQQTKKLLSDFGANLSSMILAMDTLKNKKKIVNCLAGNVTGVIYENGDVALCELLNKVGNLRAYDCNFSALWNSEIANKKRARVKSCFCTHGCFLQPSLVYSPKLYLRYLRRIMKI